MNDKDWNIASGMICGGMHEQFQVVNKKMQLFTTESFACTGGIMSSLKKQ